LRYWLRFALTLMSLPVMLASMGAVPADISPNVQQTARDDYGNATQAIRRGGWTEYEQLRSGLDNYPLAVYLDYYKLSGRPQRVRPAEARRFVDLSRDTPLPNRFLAVYLTRAGEDRRWKDFLSVMPDEPNSIELKCYYFRAKLGTGDTLAAWEGAQRLWNHGESRPKQCDPLFSAWLKADKLSDEIVWQRMLKAFEARERSLMTYVARKGSAQLSPWSDKLMAVYRQPDRIRGQSLPASSPYSSDIASYGLAYLARYNPEKALVFWQQYQAQLSFNEAQVYRVDHAIALRSLIARTEAHQSWLASTLARLADDKLVEIRLRWALAEQDWAALLGTLPLLSEPRAGENVWRYWHAIAREQLGDAGEAREELLSIAGERSYYSFLAADRLGEPYAFNNKAQMTTLPLVRQQPIEQMPVVMRVEELYFHEQPQLAHSEWFKVLEDSDGPTQEGLASYASGQGWYRMAIDGANKAKAWDRLDLRFPTPYQDTFEHYASLQKVPSTELMAIARRESAFFPAAQSPVGARGLMQLMPATGKQVASSLGKPHSRSDLYEVEHNVLLGSAYYRQLLDRFNGNRVFALAAYNAGPHRVDRWRSKTGESVPVEIWVETIPYRETRNYVQAVLSYNVVFHHLLGADRSLLTLTEKQAQY